MKAYYNVGALYEIVGRITDKTFVHSYVLFDKNKKDNIILEKDIVEQLALNKQIYNCNAQIYNNTVNLKGINCKLTDLPRYNMDGTIYTKQCTEEEIETNLEIIGKIQRNRVITGYVVIYLDSPDVTFELEKKAVISLAKAGRIINARAQMNKGELMLRSAPGHSLSKLKTYKL